MTARCLSYLGIASCEPSLPFSYRTGLFEEGVVLDDVAEGAGDRASSIYRERVDIAAVFDDQYGLHKLALILGINHSRYCCCVYLCCF